MRAPLRLALAVLGLAVAVYGVASLTGGWLGEPAWWQRRNKFDLPLGVLSPGTVAEVIEPRPGREWISAAVVVAGLALAALAAWPRRRRPNPAT